MRGHFGNKILDDPLVHGPLVVDPLNKSGGIKVVVVSQSATVEVEQGPRARTPTARESFRSILDLMKDRIRVLAQKQTQPIKTSEPASV